ncbi:MAG: isochorismatase family cysteine hydrolase [Erysipelotrichaceae bacterium]
MKKLLVVVDLVNGFINEGALHDNQIKTIIPECKRLIGEFLNAGHEVVAFRDCHNSDDEEFLDYPTHCLRGSNEAEFVDEIKEYEDQMIVIDKQTTNGFTAEDFQKDIKKYSQMDEIVVVGCCTDICVLQFVMEMVIMHCHFDLKYQLVVPKDACSTYQLEDHNRDDFNAKAYDLMLKNNVKVVDHYEL